MQGHVLVVFVYLRLDLGSEVSIVGRVRVSFWGFISRVRVRVRFWLRPGTPLDPKFAGFALWAYRLATALAAFTTNLIFPHCNLFVHVMLIL